ncbi:MAG: oligosaccharide flippase family protein [Candidatus Fimadaptatus sp.]
MENRLLARAARLCAGNAAVRALGFGMRIWLARAVDEQALGIFEMSAQLSMLLLSPLVSGLPQAASRMAAQRLSRGDTAGAECAGRAARVMAGLGAGALTLVCLPLTPLLARMMGDARMALPFVAALPAAVPLALCAVYYGCMYARGSTLPASLQLTEQSVRLVCALVLIGVLGGAGPVQDATLLTAAQTAGAIVALALTRSAAEPPVEPVCARRCDMRALWRSAWPISLGRMSASGLRSVNQMLLPGRLALAGLSGAAAMREYGVLSGMALPTVFLPFMFTGPLATLALPRMAGARSRREAAHLARRSLALAGAAGGAAWALLAGLGPVIGSRVFGSARAGEMIRMLAALAPLGCLVQTLGALLQGMGRERAAMRSTLAGALCSTALTWALAAQPALGIRGFALALSAGQALTLAAHGALLVRGLRSFAGAGRSAG